MGATEVTQGLWYEVMENRPSNFSTNPEDGGADGWKKLPVERVSWYDVIAFCNKLSVKTGKTPVYTVSGITDWEAYSYSSIPTSNDATWNAATMNSSATGYRLPTEAEWMWAAMGADKTQQPNSTGWEKAYAGAVGSSETGIGNYAWYSVNSDSKTHEVGKKAANELGLYDMSGNVWEWTYDWYVSPYPSGTLPDPEGAASGSHRVVRGGNWYSSAFDCTVASRTTVYPYRRNYNYGFRVVCP
jgi:formylglycine-generating enzyme required for sulfatase activity